MQTRFIRLFEQAGPKFPMNVDRSADDPFGYLVEFFGVHATYGMQAACQGLLAPDQNELCVLCVLCVDRRDLSLIRIARISRWSDCGRSASWPGVPRPNRRRISPSARRPAR